MNLYEFSKKNILKYEKSLVENTDSNDTINFLMSIFQIDVSDTINSEYEVNINGCYYPLTIGSIISLRNTIKKDILAENKSLSFIRHVNFLTNKTLNYSIDILINKKILRESPIHRRKQFKLI